MHLRFLLNLKIGIKTVATWGEKKRVEAKFQMTAVLIRLAVKDGSDQGLSPLTTGGGSPQLSPQECPGVKQDSKLPHLVWGWGC